jgi:methylated-DNA-protein-cysteine methyltransferase-like protein
LASSADSNHSFFEQVYAIVRQIPFGKVTSYGAIAAFLGSRQSSRMVGWAMNQSHRSGMNIPAHRVVNRNGQLTGKNHFGHPDLMQQLLEQEGHQIVNDTIVNFEKAFWNPEQLL